MRYQIYQGSISGHCCFTATVVDTEKPVIFNGKQYVDSESGQPHYDSVCECFDISDASAICDALNAVELGRK